MLIVWLLGYFVYFHLYQIKINLSKFVASFILLPITFCKYLIIFLSLSLLSTLYNSDFLSWFIRISSSACVKENTITGALCKPRPPDPQHNVPCKLVYGCLASYRKWWLYLFSSVGEAFLALPTLQSQRHRRVSRTVMLFDEWS